MSFCQIVKRLQRRADLFDELRDQLRTAKKLPENETAQDIRGAIDIILKHIDVHGNSLWGHAITLSKNAPFQMRLVDRTNEIIKIFFGRMKHGERRRSGRKNLTHDFEHLPAEAALVYNLKKSDYVSVICGSIDRLPLAFAALDKEKWEREEKGLPLQTVSNIIKSFNSPPRLYLPQIVRL